MITLQQISEDIESGKSKTIYYSSKTLWWTHDEKDLEDSTAKGKNRQIKILKSKIKEEQMVEPQVRLVKAHIQRLKDSEIPLDPTGAPLFQVDKPKEFISAALGNADFYGENGIENFIATHHKNLEDVIPREWTEVQTMVDAKKVSATDSSKN